MASPPTGPTPATPLLPKSSAPAPPPPLSWREIIRVIGPLAVPAAGAQRRYAALALIITGAEAMVWVLPPLVLKAAVDVVTANVGRPPEEAASPYAPILLYFGLAVVSMLLGAMLQVTQRLVEVDVERRASVHFFRHLHSLSLGYHVEKRSGAVIKVMDRAVTAVVSLMNELCFTVLPLLLETCLVTVVFWRLGNVAIAVSTLLTVAAHTGCAYFLTKASVRFNRASNEAADAVGSREVESLSCFETVKSHGRTDAEVATYEGLRETSRAAGANGMAMMTVMHSSLSLIESLGTTAGLVIAAWATAHGTARLSPGDFVLVSMYISNLFNPLTHLVQMYKQFVLTLADLEKAAAVLMRAPDVSDADNAFDLLAAEHALKGDVVFENVSYRYKSSSPAEGTACKGDSDSESDAAGEEEGWMNREPGGVSNVSFRIPAGKTLALCGASGSGKSTIVALLLRLYDCDHGRVLVDGHDVRAVTQRSLRQVCGLVAQETVLFNDTLRYNILYGAPAAPDVQVREALRAAAMGEFLEAQDEGLDVVVGQRGLKLSGGECQRVGNARALIKDPTILVLDEATSALDSQTEKTIQGELRERFSGRTTLIIAHRLSTIVHSDEILVLSKGEIKERGTHAQLVGRPDGVYANMWRLQTVTKPPSPSSSDAASTASSREASHKASS